MKKYKLFTSLCVLALTVCTLAFGVYAAVSASFTATGTVSFNAYSCVGLIDCSVTGYSTASALQSTNASGAAYTEGTFAGKYMMNQTKLSSLGKTTDGYTAIGDATNWAFGTLYFDQLTPKGSGVDAAWETNPIVFTFTFKTYCNYDLTLKIENFTPEAGTKIKVAAKKGDTALSGTTINVPITKNATTDGEVVTTITLTYYVLSAEVPASSSNYTMPTSGSQFKVTLMP